MVCEHEYMNAICPIVVFAMPLSQSVINAQSQIQSQMIYYLELIFALKFFYFLLLEKVSISVRSTVWTCFGGGGGGGGYAPVLTGQEFPTKCFFKVGNYV